MVVDASVWVSALYLPDANNAASRHWLEEAASIGASVVPILALAEVAGAIARRTGSAERGAMAARRIEAMPGLRVIELDAVLGRSAADLAARLRLRGADAVYVATALSLSIPLVTWDDELLARAAAVVEARQP